LKDDPSLEREDEVAVPIPFTIVNRTIVSNFEIVKVCPETVAVQLLNVIGTLNWAKGDPATSQKTTLGMAGKDACVKITDADRPVDMSVMLALTVWVDGERVMEAENASPGLTVRVSTLNASGLAPAAVCMYIAIAWYVGTELPWGHRPNVLRKDSVVEFAIPALVSSSCGCARPGWHVRAGWVHSAVSCVISPDEITAAYPAPLRALILDTSEALTGGTIEKEANTSPKRAKSKTVLFLVFFSILRTAIQTHLAI
jgi:hypothetical protein